MGFLGSAWLRNPLHFHFIYQMRKLNWDWIFWPHLWWDPQPQHLFTPGWNTGRDSSWTVKALLEKSTGHPEPRGVIHSWDLCSGLLLLSLQWQTQQRAGDCNPKMPNGWAACQLCRGAQKEGAAPSRCHRQNCVAGTPIQGQTALGCIENNADKTRIPGISVTGLSGWQN